MQRPAVVQREAIRDLAKSHRQGHAMAQRLYTDEAVFDADARLIFGRNWILAGHVSELLGPGDFFLFDMLNESVIVCRDDDGSIRAFANVCRHRGSRICTVTHGKVRRFTCPYHAWTYALDGSLFSARALDAGYDRSLLGLLPVAVEVLEGLIYVSLAENPPDFAPARAALESCLAPFDLARTKIAHRARYPVAANWKLLVENYNECYHCAPAHPEYSRGHTLQLAPERTERIHDDFAALSPGARDGLTYETISCLGRDAPNGAEGFAH
ncbi:Rieske 2Fe-2S domain-containing protein, partial [Cribrihabitans sp. XS_ASV171]